MQVTQALAELATLGATSGGIDRGLFTPAEHAARTRFAAWARALGADVTQDRCGNVFARIAGSEPGLAPIQCGSHLDTVKDGGAYDGAYGVAGGLAALSMILTRGARTRHPLEVVAWAGEEGSRFPVGTLGSAVYAGLIHYAEIAELQSADGEPFADAFAGPSGALAGVPVRETNVPPAAYVELHIEQGPVLERGGARLGIVSAIAGQRRYAITVSGTAGHAGTVPMRDRADALAAAAEVVLELERSARAIGDCVATIGTIAVEPNQANVIPGVARMRADVRSGDDATIERIAAALYDACTRIGERRGVGIAVDETERRAAVAMDAAVIETVRDVCRALDPDAFVLTSGAGHDAMCVARVAPAGMIFVPSAGGRSHVGEEHTAPADLELGVEALANALVALDAAFAKN
ncbi:Zn-dependent hydrolase [Vulcanimicrobium alpinum]|uniref:Zn-dependent hydrolase n=1 Tax=Vulcanimicrobium alpinum TaxID=3016050 RepID=A0AAN2CAV4_UNVUL|nr:M20 family metallo-hydrolase [Vulcanimicrobium alpinum]BDE07754.1 Zn-dependent hydrolase [Vulcanimicrobium alpinum]